MNRTPEEIKKGLAELSAFLRERLGWTKRSNVLSDALAYIQQLEAIDAEPVRHGRWIHYDGNQFRCSNCRQLEYIPRPCWRLKDYCPNCGAKMDLEVQDD